MDNKIAYDPKNLNVIYKPIKIINDYLHYKQSELNKNKDDISSFLTESKEISKKNILIRNLTNQQNKYNKDLNERLKTLENNKRTLELYQNDLSIFQRNQKLACRKIDDLLTQLLIKYDPDTHIQKYQDKLTAVNYAEICGDKRIIKMINEFNEKKHKKKNSR
jgi:hypothetical protein